MIRVYGASEGTRGHYLLSAEAVTASEVVGRHVFYNNSVFDGFDQVANPSDDMAIAVDKQPWLADQVATFANYTSYEHGLNGIMIDVRGLADPV